MRFPSRRPAASETDMATSYQAPARTLCPPRDTRMKPKSRRLDFRHIVFQRPLASRMASQDAAVTKGFRLSLPTICSGAASLRGRFRARGSDGRPQASGRSG